MISYQKISKILLSFFKINVANQTEEDIYLYGLEILLSNFINFSIIILLSVLFHIEKEVLCFILFFAPLRFFSGGIHAKNHIRCILLFLFFLFASLLLSIPISRYPYYLYIVPCILICRILYALLQQKYFSTLNTKIATFLSFLLAAILIALLCFNMIFSYQIEYYITLASMAILVQLLTSFPLLLQKR